MKPCPKETLRRGRYRFCGDTAPLQRDASSVVHGRLSEVNAAQRRETGLELGALQWGPGAVPREARWQLRQTARMAVPLPHIWVTLSLSMETETDCTFGISGRKTLGAQVGGVGIRMVGRRWGRVLEHQG